jgi:type IV secretion system protein VirD4
MSRVAKKTDFMTISIYGVLAAFVIYFSAALGACFDLSLNEDGKADFDKLSKSLESTLMDTDLIIAQVKTGGKALEFPIFTAFGLGLYVLMKITGKKKFHRKGEEHGSARWANKKEIASLLDKPIKDKKSKSKSKDKPEIKENIQTSDNSMDIQTIEAPEPKSRDEPDETIPNKAEQQIVHKDKRSVKVRKRKEKEFIEDKNIILTNDVKMSLDTRQTR